MKDQYIITSNVSTLAGKRRLTIAQLALKAGIAYDTARRHWEGTATRIDFPTLAALCQALECQPGDLFTLAGPGPLSKLGPYAATLTQWYEAETMPVPHLGPGPGTE